MGAQPKEIRGRIRSVTSTKKITRTMELVATSKMKRAQERVNAAQPYLAKLEELIKEVAVAGASLEQPLMTPRDKVKRVRLVLLSANRGLCGGYNANVIRLAKRTVADLQSQGKEVILDVIGKKGLGTLRFQGYKIERSWTDLSDKPTYDDAMRYVEPLRKDFLNKDIDEAHFIYTNWRSLATQVPIVKQLLPIVPPQAKAGASSFNRDYIFSPDPASLLEALLPLYLTQTVYTCLVEANAGEQVARRTAMKSATDNASDMITGLTRTLNRARQAQITQEIAEIVGGAAALEG